MREGGIFILSSHVKMNSKDQLGYEVHKGQIELRQRFIFIVVLELDA
jgi:hypothetical protein